MNRIEALLLQAAKDPAMKPEFLGAILSATLLVLGRPEGENRGPRIGAGTKVQLYGVNTVGGRAIPAFTSEYRISEYVKTPQPHILLTGRDLLEMLEPDIGLVLNPASACGKEFVPEEIKRLLAVSPTQGEKPPTHTDTKSA